MDKSKIILFYKNRLFGNVNKILQIFIKYQLQLGHKTQMNKQNQQHLEATVPLSLQLPPESPTLSTRQQQAH